MNDFLKKEMKRIAIYARVSTDNGTQDYHRQINDLTKVIISQGYDEKQIEVFAERISGYKKKTERPELSRLLKTIEEDSAYFEMIFCTEISRLGRNPSETRQTIDMLTDWNVPIFIQSLGRATLDKDGKRDSIMNIILQVLLEFANAESEQMKQRSRSGLLTSAKAGRAGGSKHLPYGYKKDESKMLIVDEEEAVIVREIFDLYAEGNGVKVIRGILNKRGILTRYNKTYAGQKIKFNIEKDGADIKWADKTVLDIITNPLYKGQRRFKGELLDAPNIVSEVVFDNCEKVRLGKTHRNNLTTYTYLLKDLMKCGCCGRNYYARYKPVQDGDKVYVCSSTIGNNTRCANRGLNISLIETAIMNELMMSKVIVQHLTQTQEIKQEHEKDIVKLTNQLEIELQSLPAKQAEKARLLDVLLKNMISDESFKDKDEKLTLQISNIGKRIGLLKKEISEKKVLISKHTDEGTTRKMLEDATNNRTELRTIFKKVISKVIISDLNNRLVLVTIYLKVDGVELSPINIMIDKFSIRKKRLIYSPIWAFDHQAHKIKPQSELVSFEENVLITGKEEILERLDVLITDLEKPQMTENGLLHLHWNTINELLTVETAKASS